MKDFGAKGDGTTNDTPAINKAINEAHNDGGGDIVFPAGTYEAASIQIKSNVRFVLDTKAVISGTVRSHLSFMIKFFRYCKVIIFIL